LKSFDRSGFKLKRLVATLLTSTFLISFSGISSKAVTFPDTKKLNVSDVPFLISLWSATKDTSERDQLFCSGVLIDNYHFITAAHCLSDLTSLPIVVAASTDLKNRGQSLMITDFIVHPRYDKASLQNDIAIGRLYYPIDTSIRWGSGLGKYPEIPDNDKGFRNDMKLFGWGDLQNGQSSFVANSIKQDDYSNEASKVLTNFNDKTMMGAGFFYKNEKIYGGACYGDSGGPLVDYKNKKTYLIGITSYGSAGGCDVKKPTAYTRVAYYRAWLEKSKAQMLSNWNKKGIVVGNNPSNFSLPSESKDFLDFEKDNYGSNAYIELSKDPDAGRADIHGMMVQIYNNNFLGVNLYLSEAVDGCVLKQKGNITIQISKNSFQDVDASINIGSGSGCYRNESQSDIYSVKLPPNDFNRSCVASVKPFKGTENLGSTEIHQLSIQMDKRCLGKAEKIWIRAVVKILDGKGEGDIEPGIDMWVGPFKPNL